jgi:hypothetical protein
MPEGFSIGADPAVTVNGRNLLVMGGGDTANTNQSANYWLTSEGEFWNQAIDSSGLLPRNGIRLVTDGMRSFAFGGFQPRIGEGGAVERVNFTDQVWVHEGKNWRLFDSHAPFGRRHYPGVGSFRGSIFCIGGLSHSFNQTLSDIWVAK